jgi:hypothetical protein
VSEDTAASSSRLNEQEGCINRVLGIAPLRKCNATTMFDSARGSLAASSFIANATSRMNSDST